MKNKTKGIGFKNFRRFIDFPMLEFGDITYLVGRNNSGKSTMVKAQLLMMDYLQNQLFDTFSFDNQVLEDANIVTFGRAKNNKSFLNEIEFDCLINNIEFSVVISGKEDATKANVLSLKVLDYNEGISLKVDFIKEKIHLTQQQVDLSNNQKENINEYSRLNADLFLVEEDISKYDSKGSKEYLNLKDKRNRILNQIEKLKAALDSNNDEALVYVRIQTKLYFA